MILIKQITAIFNWKFLIDSLSLSLFPQKLICFAHVALLNCSNHPYPHHSLAIHIDAFITPVRPSAFQHNPSWNYRDLFRILQRIAMNFPHTTAARWSSLSRTTSSAASGTCAWPCYSRYCWAPSSGTYAPRVESRRSSGIALCSTIVYWP